MTSIRSIASVETLPGPLQDETYKVLPGALMFPTTFADKGWRLGKLFVNYTMKISPESYEPFAEGTFISLLSMGSLRRIKIGFDDPDYTPFFIAITAEPAVLKKTSAVKALMNVLGAAGLDWIYKEGLVTPQKLIYDMAGGIPKNYADQDEEKQHRAHQKLAFAGQKGMIIGEVGQFMKEVMNPSSVYYPYMSLILKMDDCMPRYTYETLTRSDEVVYNPFLSLIGDWTISNIKALVKKDPEMYGSGFWSRIAPIVAPAGEKRNIAKKLGRTQVPFELWNGIKKWHERLGVPEARYEPIMETNKKDELVPTGRYDIIADPLPEIEMEIPEVVYDAWVRYRYVIKEMITEELPKDLWASYDRLAVKAMRMAALLASLDGNTIELYHWAKAQEIAERWRYYLHDLYWQVHGPAAGGTATPVEDILLECLKKLQAEEQEHPKTEKKKEYPATARIIMQRAYKLKGMKADQVRNYLQQLIKDGEVMQIRGDYGKVMYALVEHEEKGLKIVPSANLIDNAMDDDLTFDPEDGGM